MSGARGSGARSWAHPYYGQITNKDSLMAMQVRTHPLNTAAQDDVVAASASFSFIFRSRYRPSMIGRYDAKQLHESRVDCIVLSEPVVF